MTLWLATALASPLGAGQGSWTSGGPEGGEVTALAVDPSSDPFPDRTLYVGTRLNGVFKSTDGGAGWSGASAGLERRVGALGIGSDGTLYAIADRRSSGVFKSADGGGVWIEVLDLEANCIAVDPSAPATVYLGTADQGVWKTVNGGTTWTSSTSGLSEINIQALAVDPLTPATVYAGTSAEGVYKSVDGGATWDDSNQGIGESSVGELAIDPAVASTLYAGTALGGMFKSVDAGANWSEKNNGLVAGAVSALAVDPGAPATLFAGIGDQLFRSTDGAASWAELSVGLTGVQFQALAVDPGSSANVWAGSGAGAARSVDGGTAWNEVNIGLRAMFVDRIVGDAASPDTLYAASPVSGVFKSPDGGASWQGVNAGLADRAITDLAISESQPQTLWAATLDEVYRTTDGGASWLPAVADPSDFGLFGQRVTALGVDPRSAERAFAGNSGPPIAPVGAGLYRTEDGGVDWQRTFDPSTSLTSFVPSCVVFDPADPDRLLVSSLTSTAPFAVPLDFQVVRSLDGGSSWLEVLSGLDRSLVELAIHPLVSSTVLVGASGVSGDTGETVFDLFRSLDGGAVWSQLDPGVPCLYSLAADRVTPDTFYLGCDSVFVSADGGVLWAPFDDAGFPVDGGGARELAMTLTSPPTLHAGTFGGVYSYTLPRLADLAVTKDDGITELAPGATLVYTVGVENLGPDDVTAATVTDALPAELDCTWTCVAAGGGVCTPGPVAGDLEDTVDLPVGATLDYSAACTLDASATDSLVNSASVAVPAGAQDPEPSNSSASDRDVVLTPGACGVFEDRALSSMLVDGVEVFEACRSIAAGPAFEIVAPGDVLFRAGEEVILADGFSVGLGAVFTVALELPAP